MMTPVSLSKLHSMHAQMERNGVQYGYGAKAEGGRDPRNGRKWNPQSNKSLGTPVDTIENIDCSGYVRFLLAKATGGELVIPDGSQMQKAWAAKAGLKEVRYEDAANYMTGKRLFIWFITPGVNGCGAIGHVGLLCDGDEGAGIKAESIESYGGHGPGSRLWSTGVLRREVCKCYELPTCA